MPVNYPAISKEAIARIHGQEDFVNFLRSELDWPIPLHIETLEDVAIPHDLQRDLGFAPGEDRIQVSRLLNLSEEQPWGIFLFEFQTDRPYLTHLRHLLRVLGSQRTLRKGDPIWRRADLLFIYTQDWQEFQFIHFSGERPESAVISSFGWKGPEDRFLHTLCKHNLARLRMPTPQADGGYDPRAWRQQWRDAFNLKPVTDEFYTTLKEVFQAVEAGVQGLHGEQRRAFTELLINRLVFLKFVEKKGWLNGDTDYLYHKYEAYGVLRFWKDFLFHLFFEGLNTDPAQRSKDTNDLLGDIPYLNAELFALSDQWDDTQVDVDNTSLNLLYDKLLNPYNFTISETSPLDVEVAFNQDLLGYAYEELIADQHGQGAYYTHPTEVNLMCRESLRAYLEQRCPQVERSGIARLVYGELQASPSAPAIDPQQAVALFTALHDVTVCDPAIGSGTFPVAMVKHIFAALRTLGSILAEHGPFRELIDKQSLTDPLKGYDLKLHIIERSIYGCDIDYFAVQIAKLRFWVELMVECDRPVPLPNFDFKLLVGDALVSAVGTDSSGKPVTLEELWGHPTNPRGQANLSADLLRQFAEKKKEYYSVQNPQECTALRNELLQARETLIQQAVQFSKPVQERTDKHVLWQIDFAEIFLGKRPGFDIVIANPPYLRQELIDRIFEEFNLSVRKSDLIRIYNLMLQKKINGQSDIYIYFFFRGLMLNKKVNGILCFICSNSWLDVDFGRELQEYLVSECQIRYIIENNIAKSFEQADINTTINLFLTQEIAELAQFVSVKEKFSTSFTLSMEPQIGVVNLEDRRIVSVPVKEITQALQNLSGSGKWGAIYLRSPDIYFEILGKLKNRLVPLKTIIEFYRGITTGNNDFFILDEEQAKQYQIPTEFLYPILSSMQEIDTLSIKKENLQKQIFVCPYSLMELKKMGFSEVADYIESNKNRPTLSQGKHTIANQNLAESSTLKARNQWWSVRNQAPGDIIVPRLFRERFYLPLNIDSVIASDMFFVGKVKTDYDKLIVTALINSSLTYFFIEILGRINVGGRINFYGSEINELLIPDPNIFTKTSVKSHLISLIDPLLKRKVKKIGLEIQETDRIKLDVFIMSELGIDNLHAEMKQSFASHVISRLDREKSTIDED